MRDLFVPFAICVALVLTSTACATTSSAVAHVDPPSASRAAVLLRAADDARRNGDARAEVQSLKAIVAIEPASVLRVEAERRLAPNASRAPSLRVKTSEPADIGVDGEIVGRTPLAPIAIAPGRHVVTAFADGFDIERAVVVLDVGDEADVALALAPLPRPTPRSLDQFPVGECACATTQILLPLVFLGLIRL